MAEPVVSPVAFLGGAGMVAVAVAFTGYVLYRRLGFAYFLLGAALWIVTVALKFAWAIPTTEPLRRELERLLPWPMASTVFCVYGGAITGATEVAITWLVLRYTRLGQASWNRALSFGVGFGAIEALLLGFASLMAVTAAILRPASLPAALVESLASINVAIGLAPIWERFFTVWIHIFSNVLIFYAIATRSPRWFWTSFVYKSGIDAVATWASLSFLGGAGGADLAWRAWSVEMIVAAWGIVGWLGTRWLRQRYPSPGPPDSGDPSPDASAPAGPVLV
jgi:uncharacterized membrane protein YhfC